MVVVKVVVVNNSSVIVVVVYRAVKENVASLQLRRRAPTYSAVNTALCEACLSAETPCSHLISGKHGASVELACRPRHHAPT